MVQKLNGVKKICLLGLLEKKGLQAKVAANCT